MKEDLLRIINNYGVNNQQRKLNEEVFELQEAITIYDTAVEWDSQGFFIDVVPDKEHIKEELADVKVILDQIQHYYEIEDKEIEEVMKYKIERQLSRIKDENKQ